jgi:hypothetical protein
MKKSLHFLKVVVMLLFPVMTTTGQTTVLAENFSGFTAGNHVTPSTSDVSASLDSKTGVPGWSGSLIYPAGGEIKVGTSSLTGWIETPAIDLSPNEGNFVLEFDICRWTGDATTVQVYHNGSAIGEILTPSDNFQKVRIQGNSGTSISKIRILGLTKRFYVDNISVISQNIPTEAEVPELNDQAVELFPVPACDKLNICNIQYSCLINVYDIYGRLVHRIINEASEEIIIDISSFLPGIYIVTIKNKDNISYFKFLKI